MLILSDNSYFKSKISNRSNNATNSYIKPTIVPKIVLRYKITPTLKNLYGKNLEVKRLSAKTQMAGSTKIRNFLTGIPSFSYLISSNENILEPF